MALSVETSYVRVCVYIYHKSTHTISAYREEVHPLTLDVHRRYMYVNIMRVYVCVPHVNAD